VSQTLNNGFEQDDSVVEVPRVIALNSVTLHCDSAIVAEQVMSACDAMNNMARKIS
jgi:hypothetical protein